MFVLWLELSTRKEKTVFEESCRTQAHVEYHDCFAYGLSLLFGQFHNPQGYQQINSLLRDIYPGHLVQTLSIINKSTAFRIRINPTFWSIS